MAISIAGLLVYIALFWNAFLAATLLPALSEITLAALLTDGSYSPLWLFLAATLGNVAGSCLNWWMGSKILYFRDKKWFPFSKQQTRKAETFFAKYGKWSLLLAWVPIIGDPLTLVSGILKTPFRHFIILVSLGKAARYAFIMLIIMSHQSGLAAT